MKKILIISYYFPPLNSIASRRFSEMAPFFYELGWEPYILTAESEGDLVNRIPDKNIFRVGEHVIKSNLVNDNSSSPSLISKIRRFVGLYFRSFDSSYFSWYRPVLSSGVIEKLRDINFDCIIASYGPSASILLGNKISKKLNVPWIADFRDLGALYKDDFYKQNFIIGFLDRVYESKNIKSACFITTVSKTLSNELEKKYNKKSFVIYNGWIDKSLEGHTGESFYKCKSPYAYYAGRFYKHQMQAVLMFLDVIKDEEIYFVIRSLGPIELDKIILEYAKSNGFSDRLIILPPASAKIIEKEQARSRVNLVFEDMSKKYLVKKGVLTGKLMQLLINRPPILAIARDDSEIGDVLSCAAKGYLASNFEQIKKLIRIVCKTNDAFFTNIDGVNSFSKKNQALKLIYLVNKEIVGVDNRE